MRYDILHYMHLTIPAAKDSMCHNSTLKTISVEAMCRRLFPHWGATGWVFTQHCQAIFILSWCWKSSGPVKTQLQLLFLLLTSLQFCSLSTITNLSAASRLLCLILDYFRRMSALLACMHVLPGPAKVRRFVAPRMRVIDDGELPSGRWELNSGSLQEQVLLTNEFISPAQGNHSYIATEIFWKNVFGISVSKNSLILTT